MAMQHPQKKSTQPRRGSEKRERKKQIYVRVSDAEHAVLNGKARKVGLSAGGFLRACGFGRKTLRTLTRAPVDVAALSHATSEMRRVGNNLNQIARALNSDMTVSVAELNTALALYVEVTHQLQAALKGHAA